MKMFTILTSSIGAAIRPLVICQVWNWYMPHFFNLPEVSYVAVWVVSVLSCLLLYPLYRLDDIKSDDIAQGLADLSYPLMIWFSFWVVKGFVL